MPIRKASKVLISIMGFFDLKKTNLNLISPSKNINAKKAPKGSIRANTPFIIPKELPTRKPPKKIIINNEYLLHGFTDQFANLSIRSKENLYKIVDCIFDDIYQKENKKKKKSI